MKSDRVLSLDRATAQSFEEKRQAARLREYEQAVTAAATLRAAGDACGERQERLALRKRKRAAERLELLRRNRVAREVGQPVGWIKIGISQEALDAWAAVLGYVPKFTGWHADWFLRQVIEEALFALHDAGIGSDARGVDSLLGWRFNVDRTDYFTGTDTRRRQREFAAVERVLQVEKLLDQIAG